MNPIEIIALNNFTTIIEKIQFLSIVWTAKEALYKIIGNNIDYQKNIRIKEFSLEQDGTIIVDFFKNDIHRSFLATYRTIRATSILLWIKERK